MTQEKHIKNGIKNLLKENNEILGLVVGIFTSIAFIISQFQNIPISSHKLLIFIDVLNILIIFVAIKFISPIALRITDNEFGNLIKILNQLTKEKAEAILTRVNELIKQLVYSIRWFLFILLIFYLLQPIMDNWVHPEWLIGLKDNSNLNIFDLLKTNTSNEHNKHCAQFLSLEVLINASNLFSAAFLFLAFQVLFFVTLESDNKTWNLKFFFPLSIAIIITIVNLIIIIIGIKGVPISTSSFLIKLLGGIYNGVAMLLLFSRFISMEYFFKNSNESWKRNFYFYGTIIALPLYVVAQPLYGVFNIIDIADSASLFKAIVFLICFWGKLVFFLFLYTMMDKKWIHSYLFLVLSQAETLKKISIELNDVYDFEDKNATL